MSEVTPKSSNRRHRNQPRRHGPEGPALLCKSAANETLEDYSLRYAPRVLPPWTPYVVATTALGGIAYLADFAIGGSIAISNGSPTRWSAILAAAVDHLPHRNPDLVLLGEVLHRHGPADPGRRIRLSRLDAHLDHLRSFTFIFFALEGSIMAQASTSASHIPLAVGLPDRVADRPAAGHLRDDRAVEDAGVDPAGVAGAAWSCRSSFVADPGPARVLGVSRTSPATRATGSSFTLLGVGLGAGVAL